MCTRHRTIVLALRTINGGRFVTFCHFVIAVAEFIRIGEYEEYVIRYPQNGHQKAGRGVTIHNQSSDAKLDV